MESSEEDSKYEENDSNKGTIKSDKNSTSSEESEKTQNNNADFHNTDNKSVSSKTDEISMPNNRIFESSSMNEQIELAYSEPKKLREAIENNVTTFTEEQRRDIIDEVYSWTWNNLGNYIETTDKYKSKYEVTNNMYGLFNRNEEKDKILKSVGVYEVKGSNMFIFTITKCYSVVWEIYTKHFNVDFAKYIFDFLNISEYVYFYEIIDWKNNDFNNSWDKLKHVVKNNRKINELKSVIFLPYSPKSNPLYSFTEYTYKTILPWIKEVKLQKLKVVWVFEKFDFKYVPALEKLLLSLKESNIKFSKCKQHLHICIKESIMKADNLSLLFEKWDFYDKNNHKYLILLHDFSKMFKYFFNLKETQPEIWDWDTLRLERKKQSLEMHIQMDNYSLLIRFLNFELMLK